MTVQRDMFDELDNAQESAPWIPVEAGDVISGVVENVTKSENQYGEFQRLHLTTRDGKARTVAVLGGSLKKKIGDAGLKIGDGVKITYDGWGEFTKDGKKQSFKKFSVAVVRGAGLTGREDDPAPY